MSNPEKIIIDDCIVLGNAVPDEISDNRRTVCTAAYSERLGLIRIYPVPPNANMNRWEIIEVPLERNPKDNRKESWKVQGSHTEWSKIPNLIKHRKRLTKKNDKLRIMEKLHSNYGVDCVEELNKKRLSLGFIKPKIISYELVKRKKHEKTIQTTIFESINQKEPFLTIHNYDVQPRIKYRCLKCVAKNPHNQQIIEWGVYEWLRKYPTDKDKVWDNLRIVDENWEVNGFLIGNQFLYRNSFMIISIFRFKKSG